MMWSWHGDGGWWWLAGTLMMILFWGAAIWLIAQLVRSTGESGSPARPSAEDIVRERYARGEIDSEEFRRRLDDLGAHRH